MIRAVLCAWILGAACGVDFQRTYTFPGGTASIQQSSSPGASTSSFSSITSGGQTFNFGAKDGKEVAFDDFPSFDFPSFSFGGGCANCCKTLVDVLKSDYPYFADALISVGYFSKLAKFRGTVLIPTKPAFDAAAATLAGLPKKAAAKALTAILQLHFLPGAAAYPEFFDATKGLRSLLTDAGVRDTCSNGVFGKDINVTAGAKVVFSFTTTANILQNLNPACLSTIYIIDKVLLPCKLA